MFIRNGIYSTLRAKGRTALFSLLLALLTVSLALGLGLWSYCAQTLAAIDQTYTSIALLEYIGEDYPQEYAADEAARTALDQLPDLSEMSGVTLWEPTRRVMALAQGYQRQGGVIPYEDQMVVTGHNLVAQEDSGWGIVSNKDLPEEYLMEYRDGTSTVKLDQGMWENIPEFFGQLPQELPDVYCMVSGDTGTLVDTTQGLSVDISDLLKNDQVYLAAATDVVDPITGVTRTEERISGTVSSATTYSAILGQVLYAQQAKAGLLLTIDPGESGFVPQPGQRYLLHGQLFESRNSNLAMIVTSFSDADGQPPYQEIEDYQDPALDQGPFYDCAQRYQTGNNYIQVEASDQIQALDPFQQGVLYLEQGRFPDPGEPGVCVVTQDIAQQLELSVGDTLPVSLMQSTSSDPFSLELMDGSRSWTVVGLVNSSQDYQGRVWVSQGTDLPDTPLFGYQLGRAVLDNAQATQTVAEMAQQLPQGVRVTLLDQGYASASEPLQAMESTAQGITAAALVGMLAVLCLFAFLFVGRQQQAVDVMVSLGTPRSKIALWLLSGAVVVSGAAVVVGGILATVCMNALIQLALHVVQGLYQTNLRYSDQVLGAVREAPLLQHAPLWPGPTAAGLVFLVSVVLCLAFLRQAYRKNTRHQGKFQVRVPRGRTSTAGRGALRFALLSALRGGWRSVVVPVVSLVLSGVLCLLMVIAQGWGAQRDRLYHNSTITGVFTSTNGRQYTDLQIANPWALRESGMVSDIQTSFSSHYWLAEDMPTFADTEFGQSRERAWIGQQDQVVFLNALDAAPAFLYSGTPPVTWLEGWDEHFLADPNYYDSRTQTPWPCVASQGWMDAHGVSLGGEIDISMEMTVQKPGGKQQAVGVVPIQVVGAYDAPQGQNTCYMPLSYWVLPPWSAQEDQRSDAPSGSFGTCRFTLSDASQLEQFRSWLEQEGYSTPLELDGTRTTVVLKDGAFVQTAQALERYLTLSQFLFPVLFLLLGVMGFVVSWLMVQGRRSEFAIMGGLGASKGRMFASFFLEQLLLCLAGGLACGLLFTLAAGTAVVWLAVLGFVACYLAGCSLAVAAVGRTKIAALLS